MTATLGARLGGQGHVGAAGTALAGVSRTKRERAPSGPSTWRRPPGRAALAVSSGLLLWASFPPRDWWWAAPLGVAVLLAAVEGARRRRAAFAYGALSGVAFFAPLLSWTTTIGIDAWLALVLLQAGFTGLLGVLLAALRTRRYWPVWTSSAWVMQEALRDRLPFGGFPWGRLAFGQTEGPLLQYAGLAGAPLVSFATALLGALVFVTARVLTGHRCAVASVLGACTAASIVLAVPVAVASSPPARGTVSVAAVQGGVPASGLQAFAEQRAVLRNHADATRDLAADVAAGRRPAPDLVLWPENSSDIDPYTDQQAYRTIDAAVRAVGVPTLVGAVVEAGPGAVHNDGIVWDPATGPGDTYTKQHLVPFGEYVPFRRLLTRLDERFGMVARDFQPGTTPGLLQVGPARVGDVICFEVAYDGLVRETVMRGAQFLVVQTNNATFGYSAQTEQQLAMSRLRAVEHGRDVVVVATSGLSGVIGPDGAVRQRTELFTSRTLSSDVALREGTTLASRVGGHVEAAVAAVALLPLALSRINTLRRRGRTQAGPVASEEGRR